MQRHGDELRSGADGVVQAAEATEQAVRSQMDALRRAVDAKEQALLADLHDVRSQRSAEAEA